MFSLQKGYHSSTIFILIWLTCTLLPICLASGPTREEARQFVNTFVSPRASKQCLNLETKFDPEPKQPECPPCFNCHLPAFQCSHFANCSDYDGKCLCPPGFGGEDCSKALCNSLADGPNRRPREKDQVCECSEGWEGINCNGWLYNCIYIF